MSYVQSASSRDFGATSSTATLTGVTAGNALVGAVAWFPTSVNLTSLSGGSNTYNQVGAITGAVYKMVLFYAENVNSGSCPVQASFSGSASVAMVAVHEVSGRALSGAIDGFATVETSFGAGTDSATSSSITPTVNGAYIFGVDFNTTQNGAFTAGTGFNGRISFAGNNGVTEDAIQAVAGSIAAVFSSASFDTHLMGILALAPAASGQPMSKRRGGVIHAVGAQPLGVRRW